MDIAELEGIVSVLPTPLSDGGGIDAAGIGHLVDFAATSGMDAVVVLGTNGEYPYLSFAEKQQVMAVAAESAAGRIPVIGTASAPGTDTAVALARAAAQAGCDGVMAAVPLCFDLNADQAVDHFAAVAAEGELPLFYYHFPDANGLDLRPDEIARIAEVPGCIGAKITVVNTGFLGEVIDATRPFGWRVFTGTCFLLADCVNAGGVGTFCPLPLVAPAKVRSVLEMLRAGEWQSAQELQAELRELLMPIATGLDLPADLVAKGFEAVAGAPYEGAGAHPQPTHALLKEALRLGGHPISSEVRRPYAAATDEQSAVIAAALEKIEPA